MENGQLTPNFLLWCRKTEHLKGPDWVRGFEQLEWRVREAGRLGEEEWPPSYAAFVGYCEPPVGSQAHKVFPKALPEPKEVIHRRKQQGREYCARLMSMFDE